MNTLALAVYQLTRDDQQYSAIRSTALTEAEHAALHGVLPLIRRSTRSLALILKESGPLDVWLAPALSEKTSA